MSPEQALDDALVPLKAAYVAGDIELERFEELADSLLTGRSVVFPRGLAAYMERQASPAELLRVDRELDQFARVFAAVMFFVPHVLVALVFLLFVLF